MVWISHGRLYSRKWLVAALRVAASGRMQGTSVAWTVYAATGILVAFTPRVNRGWVTNYHASRHRWYDVFRRSEVRWSLKIAVASLKLRIIDCLFPSFLQRAPKFLTNWGLDGGGGRIYSVESVNSLSLSDQSAARERVPPVPWKLADLRTELSHLWSDKVD